VKTSYGRPPLKEGCSFLALIMSLFVTVAFLFLGMAFGRRSFH